ncbi:MAG TPA: FG-GAP-like repeat-containing protein [Flavobacteriales bacterium]|nr:FG-GAP-like repeat-containing protein [Flavobacteriales bacterium]
MNIRTSLALLSWAASLCLSAQSGPVFMPDVPVLKGGSALALPWGGGLNAPQVSAIDLNQDGLMDLFLLDRSGDAKLFLLNTGTTGHAQYTVTHDYDDVHPLPLLHDWALLRDYNCDGKMDIFAYTNGAFAVYRNTSDASGLSFTLAYEQVGSNYVPTISPNLYVSNVDLPGIVDMDGDGDLDVVTFSIWGNILEYHKNLSMELYGHCDSLVYEVRSRCWGDFQVSVSSNAITLDMPCPYNVPNPEMPHPGTWPSHDGVDGRAHSGSTSLPIDLNGDGLMDLLLGDFQTPHLSALINGGTASHAHMISADSVFPAGGTPIHFREFLGAFHVDIDGDGRRDLVVAPNIATESANTQGIWYYRNTGTDAAPTFQFQREDLFQGEMLDFGSGARPVLFDHNSDGLMDLVVANEGYFQPADGSYRGALALLQNTGTATSPVFSLVDEDYGGLSGLGLGPGLHPAFGDVNGDGKPDMIVGDLAGTMRLFLNISPDQTAQFQTPSGLLTNDQGAVIDVGANATPQLFDLDGDGLLDLVVGERNGNLNHYRNTGTATAPLWHLETENLGGVRVNEYWSGTGYSVPFFYKDADGQTNLVVGSEIGGLHRYDGITDNLAGTWNLVDSIWLGLREGGRTGAVLYDFLGHGHLALIVGNYRGGLSFWATDESGTQPDLVGEWAVAAPFTLAPNPAAGEVEVRWHAPLVADLGIELLDGLGRQVRTQPMRGASGRMALDGVAPGLYLVRVGNGQVHWAARLAVAR